MQYQMHGHIPSENLFLRVEKNNIKIGAIVLLLIGLALFFLTIKFIGGKILFFSLVLPICYIITGIFGLFSVAFNSNLSALIYFILLIILIIINILSALLSVGILVYLITHPFACDSSRSDACGPIGVVYYLSILISGLVCIISTAFAIMLFVFLKNVRNYRKDIKQFEMSEF